MADRHIADQAWRGYLNIADNLYTQLYQLNFSKCINSITHNWISHWEKFVFNSANAVESPNALYPYAFTLPENVKSVYLLRESPRNISVLPSLTLLLNNGAIILPDGSIRFPGDLIYGYEDLFKFDITCPSCAGTGTYAGETCIICDGTGDAKGLSSEAGIAVDTVKYYKRADSYSDYDESATPLGDFVVYENEKIIAFATQPYETLWSEYTIRDTEIIYDNFGSLIKFYKPDSYRYLRQLQGLWFAYWDGSNIDSIKTGLNVVTDLPFVTDAGYVESIDYKPNAFLKSIIASTVSLANYIKLPVLPSESNGAYDLILKIRNKPAYALDYGIDYEIIYDYEDANDYLAWYSFDDFNNINAIPSITKQAFIKFYDTESFRQLADADFLDIYFKDGSGDYIIKIAGRDYLISSKYVPAVVVNQYLERYSPLISLVNVYDYINFPKWWENLLGYGSVDKLYYTEPGRKQFDSEIANDSAVNLDSSNLAFAITDLPYYHTFLVSLEGEAAPSNYEEVRLIKSFLDTIKPSYSHYIIRCNMLFEDTAIARDVCFALELQARFDDKIGPTQRLDDTWIRSSLDHEILIDANEHLGLSEITCPICSRYAFTELISDNHLWPSYVPDLKAGHWLDRYTKFESLAISRYGVGLGSVYAQFYEISSYGHPIGMPLLPQQAVIENVVVGTAYQAYPEIIPGYAFERVDANNAPDIGTVGLGDKYVIFYYLAASGYIMVWHLVCDATGEPTGEVLQAPESVITYLPIGTPYHVVSKSFYGYDYYGVSNDSSPASGTIGVGAVTIKFLYNTDLSSVIVTHLEIGVDNTLTGVVLSGPTTVINGAYVGTTYNTAPLSFPDHDYYATSPSSDPASGIIGVDDSYVEYLYKIHTGSVYVSYLVCNSSGVPTGDTLEVNELVVLDAAVGTAYSTVPKNFAGYAFYSLSSDSAQPSGSVVNGVLYVKYLYTVSTISWLPMTKIGTSPAISAYPASDGKYYISTESDLYVTTDFVTFDTLSLSGTRTGLFGNIMQASDNRLVVPDSTGVWVLTLGSSTFTRSAIAFGNSYATTASSRIGASPNSNKVIISVVGGSITSRIIEFDLNTSAQIGSRYEQTGYGFQPGSNPLEWSDKKWLIPGAQSPGFAKFLHRFDEDSNAFGVVFSIAQDMSAHGDWPVLAINSSGRVYFIYAEVNPKKIKIRYSDDGFVTWTDMPEFAAGMAADGNNTDSAICFGSASALVSYGSNIFRTIDGFASLTKEGDLDGDKINQFLVLPDGRKLAFTNSNANNIWYSMA